jgi:hypothetical protein
LKKRVLALEKKASQVEVLENKYAASLQAQNKMRKALSKMKKKVETNGLKLWKAELDIDCQDKLITGLKQELKEAKKKN